MATSSPLRKARSFLALLLALTAVACLPIGAQERGSLPEQLDALDIPVLCVYGTRDKQTLCALLPDGLTEVVPQDAGHRLHSPGQIADMLLRPM